MICPRARIEKESGGDGIRTHEQDKPVTGFQVRRLQPLSHPTGMSTVSRRSYRFSPAATAPAALATLPCVTEPPAKNDVAIWIEHVKSLGPVVVTMVVMSLTLPAILGFVVLGQAALYPDAPKGLIEQWGVPMSAAAAAIFFALTTGSAILPTYALSFACGVYFGGPVGAAVAMAGVTFGAMVGYGWGAIFARKRVMEVIDENPKAAAIRSAIIDRRLRDELLAVTLIRIPPNSPFAITNLVMSSSGVKKVPYAVGTAVGMAPRTIMAAMIGGAVGQMDQVKSAGGRLKWAIGIGVSIVVFLILYRVFSKWAQEGLSRLGRVERVEEEADSRP